jgi:hypothetical protein
MHSMRRESDCVYEGVADINACVGNAGSQVYLTATDSGQALSMERRSRSAWARRER